MSAALPLPIAVQERARSRMDEERLFVSDSAATNTVQGEKVSLLTGLSNHTNIPKRKGPTRVIQSSSGLHTGLAKNNNNLGSAQQINQQSKGKILSLYIKSPCPSC